MKRWTAIALLVLCPLVVAQSGSIQGMVMDRSAGLIPGAEIKIENLATGLKWQTLSDKSGEFQFVGLPPGQFRVDVSLKGFKSWITEVRVGSSTARLEATLEVAEMNSVIVVSVDPSYSIRQTSASVGEVRAARAPERRHNTESYSHITDNAFIRVADKPRSTFAIDVDTASYANVPRFLSDGQLPPRDAVRIEELVNYFSYSYPTPTSSHPVAIYAESAPAFWEPQHRLVRIGIRAKDVDISKRKAANLVFLIDVSGSMQDEAKLPLVQRSLRLLVDQLKEDDRVSMVVYAGRSGLVLPATSGAAKGTILTAIDNLRAGGSTNGAEGIRLAYQIARENFIPQGINRVILATDGDFNVGITNEGDLVSLIQKQADSGVFLTVLGFGVGNYKDATLEKLADKGHGNYAYIDTINEAKRVFVEQVSGTLMTVAKDVKLQIEFNPAAVEAYRLVGYENRLLNDADFDNDAKQGGDLGAGHHVTALFEVVPKGFQVPGTETRPLKYQKPGKVKDSRKGEILTVSLRYKLPTARASSLIETPVMDNRVDFSEASADFRFASSVAAFGMLLRESPYRGLSSLDAVVDTAQKSMGADPWRAEFVELVRKAAALGAGTQPQR